MGRGGRDGKWGVKTAALFTATAVDLLMAELPWVLHPVRAMGTVLLAGRRWNAGSSVDRRTRRGAGAALLVLGAAAGWRLGLQRRGLRIRLCDSFGLPDHVRIAVRRPGENRRLLDAIRETL